MAQITKDTMIGELLRDQEHIDRTYRKLTAIFCIQTKRMALIRTILFFKLFQAERSLMLQHH